MPYEDRYFEWLVDIIKHNGLEKNHHYVLQALYDKPFRWSVANDDNREADGERLRDRFGWDGNFKGCSVLEMMVALAERIEHDITGEPGNEDKTYYWFWLMVDNLGLLDYDDDRFNSSDVDYILENFLDRRYFSNGTGGLFPLKITSKDQRKVEIWFQMCAFLDENYDF